MSAADLFDLTGKVGLVTGANSGLGFGFASGIAEANTVKRGALEELLARSGGENFSEVRWLESEIRAIPGSDAT